jgi:hypothetical protein
MKVVVENLRTEEKKTFEGDVPEVVAQLQADYPHIAQGLSDPSKMDEWVDALASEQDYTISVHDQDEERPLTDLVEYHDPWLREGDQPDMNKYSLIEPHGTMGRERVK